MSWGYHLIVDASGCLPNKIRCATTITMFAKRLVDKIDMVPFGEPQVVMFGSGNKKGYTLVQLIETSNITAHFVEETDDVYLDVFSCKPFDPKTVVDVMNDSFRPLRHDVRYMIRQAPVEKLA